MGNKRKRKKGSFSINAKDMYKRGMDLYLDEDDYTAGLKFLLRAAKAGYKPAYGEIGIILYREKNETDKAEKWFKKAQKVNSLFPLAAYEYGMLFYRDKLPKFNNNRKMVFNSMPWPREMGKNKIHPTQKPVKLLERLIELFTDPGDVVIDPLAGSGSTLIAAENSGRKAYGFEIKLKFYKDACKWIEENKKIKSEIKELGYAKTKLSEDQLKLF